jgi:hypothetical protein
MKVYVIIREEWDSYAGSYNECWTTIKGIFTDKKSAKEAAKKLKLIDAYRKKSDYSDMGIDYTVEEFETDKIVED